MKLIRSTSVFVITTLLAVAAFAVCHTNAAPQHGFSVPQYEQFHEVLHPLEHEALPKNDFKQIRNKAPELVRLGKAIVAVGVPAGTKEDQKQEFTNGLKKFDKALKTFRTDAKTGSDAKLKASYSAVHDSFEMLAAMLPRS